ncbi:hypothetical protein CC86DRAFT_411369 [Ophiobolus disseminans]|uniref:Uncharacterized protein n=1 Tax=Ophiobolus disseminans TaxID=1469910 RepID=A0A6A6ZIZ2_9PLEO|nr:hypothetical protein CC86DRAFT_411369 [Ophiobolus disseminans]
MTSPTNIFALSTELADLGRERFDHDTAQATDRDASLFTHGPVAVREGRAPKGLEKQVFAWNTFKFTTEERDDREELKGDLHEGQLHRQNRAARDPNPPTHFAGGGGRGGARAGRAGWDDGKMDALCAGRKPEGEAPPLAKGYAEEMDKSMFWDEPIV